MGVMSKAAGCLPENPSATALVPLRGPDPKSQVHSGLPRMALRLAPELGNWVRAGGYESEQPCHSRCVANCHRWRLWRLTTDIQRKPQLVPKRLCPVLPAVPVQPDRQAELCGNGANRPAFFDPRRPDAGRFLTGAPTGEWG